MKEIVYLSTPEKVSMADSWFQVASPSNFWVKRRFRVFRTLVRPLDVDGMKVAEIGCGHGLVQHSFRQNFGQSVDGYELNQLALEQSVCPDEPRFIYNIFDRNAELKEKYDMIILFDVIEHLEDDRAFLDAVLFHLKFGGYVVINVPALQGLFSKYDEASGHFRRYEKKDLSKLSTDLGLSLVEVSFWGLPYLPILWLRKRLLAAKTSEQDIISTGFKPPSSIANTLLAGLGYLELIPNHIIGTSLMCLVQKK